MANWLTLIIVGCLIYVLTLTPIFPAEWKPAASILGGLLAFLGVLLLVLKLLGVGLP